VSDQWLFDEKPEDALNPDTWTVAPATVHNTSDIPDEVLDTLEQVRLSGQTNMFDYGMVCWIIMHQMTPDHMPVLVWLVTHEERFVDALVAMGERVPR